MTSKSKQQAQQQANVEALVKAQQVDPQLQMRMRHIIAQTLEDGRQSQSSRLSKPRQKTIWQAGFGMAALVLVAVLQLSPSSTQLDPLPVVSSVDDLTITLEMTEQEWSVLQDYELLTYLAQTNTD
ncbi:MAG: hypothetical protein ABWW63_00750 [Glaciecola sp.]|jgi:hypothetical protein